MKGIIKGMFGLVGIVVLGFALMHTEDVATKIEETSGLPQADERQLVSYSMSRELFDNAYQNAMGTSLPENLGAVRGVLVPHHLLAAPMIAQSLNAIPSKSVKTVVLISPDHFAQIREPYVTSKLSWKTPYGTLEADRSFQDQLKETLPINDNAFMKEHGVSGIIPFVKKSFPGARIVPIMVSDYASLESIERLAAAMKLDDSTLVVGSFDFSHYLPQNVADYHDETAIAALENLDVMAAMRLDIDSRTGFSLLLLLMKQEEGRFEPIAQGSANIITKKPDSLENTSYISGVFGEQNPREHGTRVTLQMFGDIMLDRRVRKTLDEKGSGYPFELLQRFMMGSDRVIANLEGPVTTNKSVATSSHLVFTFDPKHIPTLKKFGITDVSLANNHTLNFGAAGLKATRETLKKMGLRYFGDPSNESEISYIDEIRGVKVAYVGYHQFAYGFENVIAEIKKVRTEADVVIVYPHWGTEYETTKPTSRSKQEAHAFIDAGADIVMGGHPHVVQPIEIYNGKTIFYSLGNFVFDQQFSEDVKTGLSVGVVLKDGETDFYLFPIEHNDFRISLSGASKRDILLSKMSTNSIASDDIKKLIKQGMFTIPH